MKKAVVSPGAEVLLSGAPLPKSIAAKAARVGLITNPTGVLPNLRPTFDVLAELYTLAALFSPEHGVRGDVDAGGDVPDYVDEATAPMVPAKAPRSAGWRSWIAYFSICRMWARGTIPISTR